jgi:hypothetical protein
MVFDQNTFPGGGSLKWFSRVEIQNKAIESWKYEERLALLKLESKMNHSERSEHSQ